MAIRTGAPQQGNGGVYLLCALLTLPTVIGPVIFLILAASKSEPSGGSWACSACGGQLSKRALQRCPHCRSAFDVWQEWALWSLTLSEAARANQVAALSEEQRAAFEAAKNTPRYQAEIERLESVGGRRTRSRRLIVGLLLSYVGLGVLAKLWLALAG